MAQRLTTFSKLLLTIVIVGVIFFAAQYFLNNTQTGKDLVKSGENTEVSGNSNSGSNSSSSSSASNNSSKLSGDDVISIGVVTWGGYAGGQYFNEGFEASTQSRFYKDYGLKVEFKVLDDFEASRDAFRANEVQLLWQTIDAFPTEVNGLSDHDPVILWQADWSRGGDAIVAKRGINRVSDLRGKTIAVAELTPSHSFLIWLLDAGGLTMKDVKIVPQPSAIDAAEVFKSGNVDAAVVWSPDDILCVEAVKGSRIIKNSENTNIIADVFMAKRAWADANEDKLRKLYEGWMKGAAEINSNASAKLKAAKILAEEFTDRGTSLSTDDAMQMIDNVRLTTHGDNKNFFGLSSDYTGMDGNKLYTEMAETYRGLGFIEGRVPAWRQIAYPKLVRTTTLASEEHFPERTKTYTAPTAQDTKKEAVSSKPVSINFRTGEFQLDANAKNIIDRDFVDVAKAFNTRIRIEGNTDNVGNHDSNVRLSKKRAQSVVDYLISEHNMERNRFIVVGNGPDKPVPGCERNQNDRCKEKNRRTDFQLVE